MISHITEAGLPNGIFLYTLKCPTQQQLNEAVTRFHEFPLLNNIPFVVLGEPEDFSDVDKIALKKANVPGF